MSALLALPLNLPITPTGTGTGAVVVEGDRVRFRKDNHAPASAPGANYDSDAGYMVGSEILHDGQWYKATVVTPGAAEWVTINTPPGGVDGSLQYKSGTAFAGDANLTWSGGVLGVTGRATINAVTGNPLTVQANGVNALVIDASKNATFSGAITVSMSTAPVLTLESNTTGAPAVRFVNSAGEMRWEQNAARYLVLRDITAASGRIFVGETGNVGIGHFYGPMALPKAKLDVQGSVAVGYAPVVDVFTAPSNGLVVKGNVGIGTNSPSALLHVAGTALLNATTGNPLTVQAGGVDALVIDASKNATFSGTVSCTGVGTDSERFGASATADGNAALAVGKSATAAYAGGVAVGRVANVTGSYGVAVGFSAVAKLSGVTIGYCTVVGEGAVTIGYGAQTGGNAIAIGVTPQATGSYSIAIGRSANVAAGHNYSIAIGGTATTTGSYQCVIGGDTAGAYMIRTLNIVTGAANLVLQRAGNTYLTVDTSQNATFSGTLTSAGSEIAGNGWPLVCQNTSTAANSFALLRAEAGSASFGGGIVGTRSADYLAAAGIVNGVTLYPFGTAQDVGIRVYNTAAAGWRSALFVQNGTGSVGINTTTPSSKLHVRDDSGTGARVAWIGGRSSWSGGTYEEIGLGFNSIRSYYQTGGTAGWELTFHSGSSADFVAGTQPERMRIGRTSITLALPATINAVTGSPLTVQAGGVDALVVDSSRDTNLYRNLIQRGATSGAITHAVPATITSYTLTWPAALAAGTLTVDGSGQIAFTAAGAAHNPATLHSSIADILDLNDQEIQSSCAAAADRIVFWDQSAGKLTYLQLGTGLSITDTTITATGGGGGAFNDLSDVDTTGATTGSLIRHNGTSWVVQADSNYAPASHNHNAAAINAGTLAHEYGGLEADVSAYNGLVRISGGSTSAVSIGTTTGTVAAGDHNHSGVYDPAGTATSAVGTHESTHNHANFAAAYGWGNHAAAGYASAGHDHAGSYDALGSAAAAYAAAAGYTTTHESSYNHTLLHAAATIGDNATDVLSITGQAVSAVDAGADKVVCWDDTSNKLTYKALSDFSLSGHTHAYEPTISAGTTAQYWRGDKSWQTLDKSAVGLGSVENTQLSTWAGSANITTVGTIGAGTWNATAIGLTKGGLGADISGYTGYVKIASGSASNVTASGVLDDISSTRGTVLYRGASGWAALAPGTDGYQLTTHGAGQDPTWAAAGGGISNVVEDVTPQLGGSLDCNGYTIHFGSETTQTPTGTTATVDLNTKPHHTLDCGSASGDITVTLTVPTGIGAGVIIVKQGATGRNVTVVTSAGSVKWMDDARPVSGDANKYRLLTWRWNGSLMFLAVTEAAA